MTSSPAGAQVLSGILLADQWVQALVEATSSGMHHDPGHIDRIEALEDGLQRLVRAGQHHPAAIRRGVLAGYMTVCRRIAIDMDAAGVVIEIDDIEAGDDFKRLEVSHGTVSAICLSIAAALSEVDQELVGDAAKGDVPAYVPNEIVNIAHQDAVHWTASVVNAISEIEAAIISAPDKDRFSNTMPIRDAWVACLSISCGMVQIADDEALDSRAFLVQVAEAGAAAERALNSLTWRRSLPDWQNGDLFGEAVTPHLAAIKDIVSSATDLVVSGLMHRPERLDRIRWRSLSRGKVGLSDGDIDALVAIAPQTLLRRGLAESDEDGDTIRSSMREAASKVGGDWKRRH